MLDNSQEAPLGMAMADVIGELARDVPGPRAWLALDCAQAMITVAREDMTDRDRDRVDAALAMLRNVSSPR